MFKIFSRKVACCRLPLYTVADSLTLVRRGRGLQSAQNSRMSKAPSSPSHKGRNYRKTRNAQDLSKDNEVSRCLCINYRLRCEHAALCSTISSYCSCAYGDLIDRERLTSRQSSLSLSIHIFYLGQVNLFVIPQALRIHK